ncbi:NfeD family protein [candidate division KSB1 bacterium]|nr:NfeD family protein [candidate division KSB1 bacterium]
MDAIKEFFKPEIIWFIIGIALLIMEFAIPGLVVFFFGVGACIVATLLLIFHEMSLTWQLIIFLSSSLILLFSLRKWLAKIFIGRVIGEKEYQEIEDDFIGHHGIVIAEIKPKFSGKIELNGTGWNAEADEVIKKGTPVEIIGKDNLTLKVKQL